MIDLDELIAKLHNLANLKEFVDDALAELLSDAADALESVRAERDVAVAAVERVRAVHRKDVPLPDWPECAHCKVGMLQDPVDWPCPTIRALEGDDA